MDYLLIALIAVLSAFVQASVGFGYSLVFTPLAALFIAPSSAIATSIVTSVVIATALFVEYQPRASFRSVGALVIPSLAATPLGLWLLAVADEDPLRLLIGVGVLVSAGVNLYRPTHHGPQRPDRLLAQVAVGALSGVMRGAVSLPGPPIILYQHWVGGGAAAIRGRMFAFFLWGGLLTVPMAMLGGVIDAEVWGYSAATTAGLPLGVVAGRLAHPRISELAFARLSMGLLGGTACMAAMGAALAIVR